VSNPRSLTRAASAPAPGADLAPVTPVGPVAPPRWRDNPRVEDYLDHLCAPLLGVVPFAERERIRQEARSHLEFLIEDYVAEEGLDPTVATELAVREYGPPDANGQMLLAAWWGRNRGAEARAVRYGGDATTVYALCAFGLGSALSHYLLQVYAVVPRTGVLYLPLVCLSIVAPIVAGLIVGGLAPVKASRGVCRAMAGIIAHSLLAGLLLLPDKRGLFFALFQLFYWLPVGLLAALGSESLARQHRQHALWRAGLTTREEPTWNGRPLAR
jgi:hypothetical protein